MKTIKQRFLSDSKKSSMLMLQRELNIIKAIPSLFTLVFVYPVLVALILFAIFYKGTITQLPVAVVDQDKSVTSRQLIQKISATQEVLIAERYSDLTEAKKGLLTTDVYAIVLIPPNFEQDMLASLQPEITTFYNNQFMTIGNTLNRAIYSGLSASIADTQQQKIMNNNVPFTIAKSQLTPVAVELHPLFNPTLNFIYTLVHGVFPTILQIIMMLSVTASMHYERQKQPNLDVLLVTSNYNPILFFINKCLIYFVIFFITLLIFDITMISYFNLPVHGSIILLLLGNALFVISSLLISLALSMLIPDKLRNYGAIGVLSSPAFGFTGLIFPRLAMNGFAYIWGAILPVTWYIELHLDQTLRGLKSIEAVKPFGYLLLLAIVPLGLVYIMMKKSRQQGAA